MPAASAAARGGYDRPGMVDKGQLNFDDAGLMPCIAQDAATGDVLMLAWVNSESIAATEQSGELHFWSRSRNELWHKGATSGNALRVVELKADCDADALLALVEPSGPACHTGARTCFGEERRVFAELPTLERTIRARAAGSPEGSWTAELLATEGLAGDKVEEEAEEVARAAREESDERVAEEAADLLYHLLVLLRTRGLGLADAARVLAGRAGH